ncbi:MAG: insulinase family protein, partial [Coriobacteriales bacterium]|nr:insulinase family protein [Coriobacteriales bacterium]
VDHSQVVELVEVYLGGLGNGNCASRLETLGLAEPYRLIKKDTEQAHLIYGMGGLSLADEDRFAGALFDAALGGGMSSRLFQEIREKRGLAYAVFSTTISYVDTGNFVVYVGTRPENLAETVEIIQSELAKASNDGLEASELQRMQDYLIGQTVLSQESTASRMIRLGRNAISGVEILSLDEVIERYRSVSLADISRVAERVLSTPITLAIISPREPDELAAELVGLLNQQA